MSVIEGSRRRKTRLPAASPAAAAEQLLPGATSPRTGVLPEGGGSLDPEGAEIDS
jgi:hypothetical protein